MHAAGSNILPLSTINTIESLPFLAIFKLFQGFSHILVLKSALFSLNVPSNIFNGIIFLCLFFLILYISQVHFLIIHMIYIQPLIRDSEIQNTGSLIVLFFGFLKGQPKLQDLNKTPIWKINILLHAPCLQLQINSIWCSIQNPEYHFNYIFSLILHVYSVHLYYFIPKCLSNHFTSVQFLLHTLSGFHEVKAGL